MSGDLTTRLDEIEATLDHVSAVAGPAHTDRELADALFEVAKEAPTLLAALRAVLANDNAAVNRLAQALMDEWEIAEGPVTASYVASYADMARAALADVRRVISEALGATDG